MEDNSRRPKRPTIPPISAADCNPSGVGRLLDALVPPIQDQSAQAMDALAETYSLQAEPTDETKAGYQVVEFTDGSTGEVVFRGPKEGGEDSVDLLRLSAQYVAAREDREIIPEDKDVVLFGTGSKIIAGEVVKTVENSRSFLSDLSLMQRAARHARNKLKRHRSRLVAAGVVSLAMVGSLFALSQGDKENDRSQPEPIASMPRDFSQPPESLPDYPDRSQDEPGRQDQDTSKIKQVGNSTFRYNVDEAGNITEISGEMGDGTNPWALTQEAYEIVTTALPNSQDVANSNPYMASAQSRAAAQNLPPKSSINWRVVHDGPKVTLEAS